MDTKYSIKELQLHVTIEEPERITSNTVRLQKAYKVEHE